MKKIILFTFLILICLSSFVLAELKPSHDYNIPEKLTEAELNEGPMLFGNVLYPHLGVPCTEFTYKVWYSDEKGRAPEYVRINLNEKWYDMEKRRGDYKTGALYIYKYVPASDKPNWFYFEASNGVGKARAGIIDSPDGGPTFYSEKFDNNQIVLLDLEGNEVWSYDTGNDMVEGVSISKEGYVSAVTNHYIHLFSKDSAEPLWSYCENCKVPEIIYSNFAGIEISDDGNYIAVALQNRLYYFKRESKTPLWAKPLEAGVIGLDISEDGSLIAIGTATSSDEKGDKLLIYDNKGNKLFEHRAEHPGYEQTGNFYQPAITPGGRYIAVSTGCPDRRAYLFSGKGELIFRSEQLTFDSPVHKSAISDDGSLAAYSADNMQGKEIVFLFDNKGNKLWSFSSSEDSTARGVSISNDGEYIAAGTSLGNIYLFSKNSNKPLWRFFESIYTQMGEVKLNYDGSLLAAGGTSKKVYLFSRESNKPLWTYDANTWITKLDFNGEYIVAGTGMREYFGEGVREEIGEFNCKEIIKVYDPDDAAEGDNGFTGASGKEIVCGDGICIEPQENLETCPRDCCVEDCKNDLDIKSNLNEKADDEGSFCSEFDGNREACYAHPEECNWIKKDELCKNLGVKKEEKKEIAEKETICGNGLCETPSETFENCPEDCMPPEDSIAGINEEKDTDGISFFQKIIDFFKNLFGK